MQQQTDTTHYGGQDCRVFAYRERIGGGRYVTTFALQHPNQGMCYLTEPQFHALPKDTQKLAA